MDDFFNVVVAIVVVAAVICVTVVVVAAVVVVTVVVVAAVVVVAVVVVVVGTHLRNVVIHQGAESCKRPFCYFSLKMNLAKRSVPKLCFLFR